LLVYMLIGLIFSWIYIKSKNILASIVAHVLMNSVVLIILM
jgi:membrane protease YdiL (CAAX protease family)